ncbi:MAG: DUF2783 domain-containing protein [Gemmatimonadales bacterium]
MSDRTVGPGFEDADATFAALVEALEEVGDERALDFLSRLVLLLAAEVGEHERIMDALVRARGDERGR